MKQTVIITCMPFVWAIPYALHDRDQVFKIFASLILTISGHIHHRGWCLSLHGIRLQIISASNPVVGHLITVWSQSESQLSNRVFCQTCGQVIMLHANAHEQALIAWSLSMTHKLLLLSHSFLLWIFHVDKFRQLFVCMTNVFGTNEQCLTLFPNALLGLYSNTFFHSHSGDSCQPNL